MGNFLKKTLSVSPLKITIFFIILSLALYMMKFPFFHFMELKALDLRFVSRGERSPGTETVIAAIDEKSLTEMGRWPWNRTKIAQLIETLNEYGARSIGFDIVFAEPDENASLKELDALSEKIARMGLKETELLRYLNDQKALANSDLILARSIKKAGNVAMGYFFYTSANEVRHLAEEDIKKGEEYWRVKIWYCSDEGESRSISDDKSICGSA